MGLGIRNDGKLKNINGTIKVAVLYGGIGSEREVSLQSGLCVARALVEAGFNVVKADITPDNLKILDETSIDVFFPVLHGEFGEDGRLQRILEEKSFVYTGSGPAASKLAFDKMASKKLFEKAGAAIPAAVEFNEQTDLQQLEKQLTTLSGKYVIKPVRQGSSVGIEIVTTVDQAISKARETFDKFGDCMIEDYIPGREITVGILCGRTLPIIEIKTRNSFYNYHAKYVDQQTEFVFDTIEEPDLINQINRAALNCFEALGCRHFARIDFILGENKTAYVLEANTIPGFTDHSLLPKAAAKINLSMSALCERIVKAAYSSLVKNQA